MTMTYVQIASAIEQIIGSAMHDYGLDAHIEAIAADALFGNDLGMDGGDVHAIIIQCEEVFKISIPDDAITAQSRVGELTELISDLLSKKRAVIEAEKILEYFANLDTLGSFAGENVTQQKRSFLIKVISNFALHERIR